MENWTCSNCRALNHPRRSECRQCGFPRPGVSAAMVEGTQPSRRVQRTAPKKRKQRFSKTDTAVIVAIIGLIGTLITAIAASPVLIALIQKPTIPTDTPLPTANSTSFFTATTPTTVISSTDTPSLTSLDLKLEYGAPFNTRGYFPHSLYLLLPGPPTGVIEWPEIENYEAMSWFQGNILMMSVTNQSGEMIILNNKIPIEVNREPSTTLVHIWDLGFGGGMGNYRNFVTKIPAEIGQQTIWAMFEEYGSRYLDDLMTTPAAPINQPDFFALAPGETEVFEIQLDFEVPGNYTLRPGVEFAENGKAVRAWVSEAISTSIPESIIVWSADESTGELVKNGTCHFTSDLGLTEAEAGALLDSSCDFR
jgi:hypothetical protein